MAQHSVVASILLSFSSCSVKTLVKNVTSPLSILIIIFLLVRCYTTIRYHYGLRRMRKSSGSAPQLLLPPKIPYTVPFLGSAVQFLAPYPGLFWRNLFRWHPRSTGACSILVGGQRLNAIYSPVAIHALFRMRGVDRHKTDREIMIKGFGCHNLEFDKFYHVPNEKGVSEEKMNQEFLMKTDSVNELTANYSRVLGNVLAREYPGNDHVEVNFYTWMQTIAFVASTDALMGSRLLQVYPALARDFVGFDSNFLGMFFGLPRWMIPEAYAVRERALEGLQRWRLQMGRESGGKVEQSAGEVPWEPLFGSRLNRARTEFYTSQKLSERAMAAFDLGIIFAISSNAIPASGWVLLQILNPLGDETLYRRVMEELEHAQREDGSLDIPTLITLPLLQSIFHEVLRLYTDVLVTRDLHSDLILPLDESGKKQIFLQKGAKVVAPSWLGHHDNAQWSTVAPSETFYAERFLKVDPDTGKTLFTLNGTQGRFFPFGGGKTICPGRVFAKQEVLVTVAMILLSFDFEFVGFIDEKERTCDQLPGLRKAYLGSGVCVIGGDMKVRMRKRAKLPWDAIEK